MNLRFLLLFFALLFCVSLAVDLPLAIHINTHSCKELRTVCRSVSFFIAPLLHLVLWPLLTLVFWKRKAIRENLILLTFNVLATNTLVTFLKFVVGRPRPKFFYLDGIYSPTFFSLSGNFQSFPSRHAATIAVVAGFFAMRYPKSAPLLISATLLTTLARVGLNSHFLSDIVAGNLLGFSVAVMVGWVFKQFFKEKIHES
ncbi:MAG: hypothetical protein ChlgKO_08400 [Chlamydiales bacterium]